jgi:predicted MFS family arabinose efflux permease
MGTSIGPVIGAAVIGDIFRLEERGRAMGVSFAIGLIGTTVAPSVGGFITHYYSWRAVHGILTLVGLFGFAAFYFLFPETSQPGARGVDKMNAANGVDSFRFINPLEPLWLLRSPSMLLTGIIISTSQMAFLVIMVPLPYTIGLRYHITNEALIGACLLPAGVGSMVGSAIVGRISDLTVIKWRKKRKGVWYPEDRLRAAVIPFTVLVPLSVLGFGMVNKFVSGNVGLILSLVCLFFNGGGVNMTFAACAAYLVDVMQSQSSEVLAAVNAMYSVQCAIAIAVILPMINAYGIAVSYVLCALLIWICYGGLYYLIKYGDQMRAWVDIGFSTAQEHSQS